MMKIGFFGGSFNPPTIAHLNLAKQALKEYNLDIFYFVPVNDYYQKKDLIDFDKRCQMLDLIVKDEPNLRVSRIESKKSSKYSAYEILNLIAENNKDKQVYFIMGEDNYIKMPSWNHYDDLKQYKYIVFQRDNTSQNHINDKNVFYMKNNENLKISSTLIRNNLKENMSIDKYVTKEIKEYIKNNKLYL